MPAKVFDAMAMAKPTISTNVSDLPTVLEGCGWITEPGNPGKLSSTILEVLNNPEETFRRATMARQKCIGCYSWNAIEHSLIDVFKKFERV